MAGNAYDVLAVDIKTNKVKRVIHTPHDAVGVARHLNKLFQYSSANNDTFYVVTEADYYCLGDTYGVRKDTNNGT